MRGLGGLALLEVVVGVARELSVLGGWRGLGRLDCSTRIKALEFTR